AAPRSGETGTRPAGSRLPASRRGPYSDVAAQQLGPIKAAPTGDPPRPRRRRLARRGREEPYRSAPSPMPQSLHRGSQPHDHIVVLRTTGVNTRADDDRQALDLMLHVRERCLPVILISHDMPHASSPPTESRSCGSGAVAP